MSTSLFPDVNVWFALAHKVHPHHASASVWAKTIGNVRPVCFCRVTQLGLLRILTTREAMQGDAMTQAEAWKAYDLFFRNPNTTYAEEPSGLNRRFRDHTTFDKFSPKHWADGYLAAFAEAGSYSLVSFDKALAKRVPGSVLLRPATA